MVRNKRELIDAASAWLSVAQDDIRKHANAFIEKANINEEMLADILDTDIETIENMLNGTADLPMSVFAKILIATNHAIIITPVEALPPMPNGRGMNRGRMEPQRPFDGETTETPRRQPMRDHRGRFVSQRDAEARMREMPIPPFGYPMPNPDGQLPTPEEFMRQMENDRGCMTNTNHFDCDFDCGEQEIPDQPRLENGGDDAEDEIARRLARALRNNPEVNNLLRSIIGD